MTDPTSQSPAGPTDDADGTWIVSLSEIDAMGRKAARGAGYSWGMAEEAGRAARWLAAFGLPGPGMLAELLARVDGAIGRHAPIPDGDRWAAESGALCPICTGAALSDHAAEIAAGRTYRLGPMLYPALALPALCLASRDLATGLDLRGATFAATATPAGPRLRNQAVGHIGASEEMIVGMSNIDAAPPARAVSGAGCPVPLSVWRKLDAFARRTYVPASAVSRDGAGAGRTDND